ncbi:hypothetical protein OS493_014501 [Desmophyllum pertusum]|uniref:Uncharacterized protein n=1 Tax=Desmophyllum pertusum TaxID=174260 RepID=A0A9W9YPX2_9CNID|nr:hypothetical protein OS493_014501 [Desmophyllum pertusum]
MNLPTFAQAAESSSSSLRDDITAGIVGRCSVQDVAVTSQRSLVLESMPLSACVMRVTTNSRNHQRSQTASAQASIIQHKIYSDVLIQLIPELASEDSYK